MVSQSIYKTSLMVVDNLGSRKEGLNVITFPFHHLVYGSSVNSRIWIPCSFCKKLLHRLVRLVKLLENLYTYTNI
jgi:hypothetical protein